MLPHALGLAALTPSLVGLPSRDARRRGSSFRVSFGVGRKRQQEINTHPKQPDPVNGETDGGLTLRLARSSCCSRLWRSLSRSTSSIFPAVCAVVDTGSPPSSFGSSAVRCLIYRLLPVGSGRSSRRGRFVPLRTEMRIYNALGGPPIPCNIRDHASINPVRSASPPPGPGPSQSPGFVCAAGCRRAPGGES